jgi:hypothetical protein
MCTVGYLKDLDVLFKNRDKDVSFTSEEEIVTDDKIMGCRTEGTDYFSWGMNKYGCSFVSTAVNTPKWGHLIYEKKFDEAAIQFKHENEGLVSPMKMISDMLHDVKRVDDWIEALHKSKDLYKGYNLLIADCQRAYHIELYQDRREIRELTASEVITNHFKVIDHGPKIESDYPSTFRRFNYASSRINGIKTTGDVCEMLKPASEEDRKKIWRSGVFYTVSSSVIDFGTVL